MELKNATTQELHLIIKGIQSAYEFNDPIKDEYCLEWHVQDYDTYFKVIYMWTKGIIKGESGNPEYAKDDTPVNEESYFKVFRSESLTKFTKEVIASIEEVVAEPFDALMEA